MENHKQFITYKLVHKPDGTTDKLPVNPRTGGVCDAHDPGAWMTAGEVRALGLPLAFVFTKQDPFFFIDIDHCLEGDTWSAKALAICAQFPGCSMEVSQSGTGLHIFGTVPENLPHGKKNTLEDLELYTSGRFVALTGAGATGDASIMPSREAWAWLINSYFPPKAGADPGDTWRDDPVPEWTGLEDDEALIKKMLGAVSARSMVGGSVTARQLWDADAVALAAVFPDSERAFNWSSADAALLSHLAFWTGKDHGRMLRLFDRSALADRDKWREREEYRINTILYAAGACRSVYDIVKPGQDGTPEPAEVGAVPLENGIRPGFQYLAAVDQLEHFKGCVYVSSEHRVLIPSGLLLKAEQFRVVYGGFVFAMDDGSNGKSTKSAWEAFTESQAVRFPRADSLCFRPELLPGTIIEDGGLKLVNTYVPINTPSVPGDAGPFLDLLARLLPIDTDRGILLAYMAACIQYPGVKFQWAPLLQGAPGNGKTFIGRALLQAIGRRYTHLPEAKDIGNKFNSWLSGKLLIVLEEVCNQSKQLDNMESLKWMVTNDLVPSQSKGKDQETGDNRANFILFSNYKDAVQKTEDDRRFCVFYTAQQVFDDFARCGLDGPYFPKLWAWAKAEGYAIITNFLQNYQIPAALNPAGTCQRAPSTSSTQEAVLQSRTFVEQEIVEAIAVEAVGFRGGWISSMALGQFLQDRRVSIAYNKRRDIMTKLGYSHHIALPGGRATRSVLIEGGKPRLYLTAGHIARNTADPSEIVRMYCEAQGYEVPAAGAMPGVAHG